MDIHVIRTIQECYERYDGEGAFVKDDRTIPFALIRPPAISDSVILIARKTQLILKAFGYELEPVNPGFLGRVALPSSNDDSWICAFLQGHRAYFLGDLGPADLMYFAWFRQRKLCTRLEYLGISDSYLDLLGVSHQRAITYKMPDSQRNVMHSLELAFPDWHSIVGTNCAEVLRSGNLIDLEGVAGQCEAIASLVAF